jgi:cellulose synthase/poly-beta-1,6-N-acetylglucosamine synthase-like glycosyltransferase
MPAVTWRDVGVTLVLVFNDAVLVYFLAISFHYLALMVIGFRETLRMLRDIRWQDRRWLMQSPFTPAVSVIATAYNEQANIVESVRSLLSLHYPRFEVIVVNDGSTDRTLEILTETFGLRRIARSFEYLVPCRPIRGAYESTTFPNLVVVDKENGGCKADATNGGLNFAMYPLVCVLDADSVLDDDALLQTVRPFVQDPGRTVGTGGSIRIVNGCEVRAGRVVRVGLPGRLLPLIQIVEYLRSFLFGRMGWSRLNALPIISGAFGVFDRRLILRAGGYAGTSLAEDFEMVIRLHRYIGDHRLPYRLRFVPDPICWTEVPDTLRVLRRQRSRWHRGLLDTLLRHRQMIGHPRYGAVGLLSLPAFVCFELLGPVVELLGYVVVPLAYLTGILNTEVMGAFLAVALLLSMLLSVLAILLDDIAFRRHARARDLALLTLASIVENLGYRQITVWWRVCAFWEYFRGQTTWGQMERRGLSRA